MHSLTVQGHKSIALLKGFNLAGEKNSKEVANVPVAKSGRFRQIFTSGRFESSKAPKQMVL
jgi:hypothetical protein